MEFTLSANLKLLSINKAFITLRNGVRARSPDYQIFAMQIHKLMMLKRHEFKAFDDHFDYFKHEIHAELTQYTDSLYTADGRLSKASGDLGNMEKCLTDCVLIGKVDDSCITKWTLQKLHSAQKGFSLSLKIIDR